MFGQEYTHVISKRMVAGPDGSLSGYQAGAMGESWSDLDAMEYQYRHGPHERHEVSESREGPGGKPGHSA